MRQLHNICTVSSPGIRDTVAAPVLAIRVCAGKANDSKKSESAISKLRSRPFTTFTILIPPHSPLLLDTRGALPKVRLGR
jgi:hypothetical protein